MKKAREWDKELGTNIVDWDGFEYRDPDVVMSREEFERRAMHSTRMIRRAAEISQAARDAAERIRTMSITRKAVQYWDAGSRCEEFCISEVQRAIDAAVAARSSELAEEREKQLSAERTAREEAVAALRRRDKALLLIDEDRTALRQKLAQAESERDALTYERNVLVQRLISFTNERDILQRMLAAAEEKRKEMAKDFETAFRLTRKENDTLTQRVAELEAELSAVRRLLEEANPNATASLIGNRMLKARCEKLEKALAELMEADFVFGIEKAMWDTGQQTDEARGTMHLATLRLANANDAAKEALNQSPE